VSRDHRKLQCFAEAHGLAVAVYTATAQLPDRERFGLQAQIRRASVSVPTNLVEGSARDSSADYCRFIQIALGSARECEYLLGLATELNLMPPRDAAPITARCGRLCGSLIVLLRSLRSLDR
jgi:four helix bundle protein